MHILLDLDGVVADFNSAALRAHGAEHLIGNQPEGVWEITDVLGISKSNFWWPIDTAEFWENLQPYPWARELVDCVKSFGEFTVATSPGRSPEGHAGKVRWMRRFFGNSFKDYMIGKQKWLMAAPGNVLIDDSDDNVNKFAEHNGTAILFPQRWNSLSHVKTDKVDYIRQALSEVE